jgi:hypothetical protein
MRIIKRQDMRSLLLLGLVLSLVLLGAQPAKATPRLQAGSIAIAPDEGPPGSGALVTGTFPSYGSYDSVAVWWEYMGDGIFLGSTPLRDDGSFALNVTIPPDAATGAHEVIADVNYGYEQAAAAFEVTPSTRSAAYIHAGDTDTAQSFKDLLEANGTVTALVPVGEVAETDFSPFDVILAGPDSGSMSSWGSTAAVVRLLRSGKPVLGLGEGGYALFGEFQLDIGYPHGAHGLESQLTVLNPAHPLYNVPYPITIPPRTRTLTLYDTDVNSVVIHVAERPDDVALFGREVGDQTHYTLLQERGRFLFWGYDGSPAQMTVTGQDLLINVLWYLAEAAEKDTVILTDYQRMEDLGYSHADVTSLENDVTNLVGLPETTTNMTAIHRDMDDDVPGTVQTARTTWDSDEESVADTSTYVTAIDDYVENLKQGMYPNLEYIIFVGSHEVIPMKARPADDMDSPYRESEWADDLPQTSGYFYSLYNDTSGGPGYGHYLTDSIYGDLSSVNNGHGADDELIPELAVGRLVETPAQISTLLANYGSSSGTYSTDDDNMVAIGSNDYMDGAQQAADHMGTSADTTLIQSSFDSSLVPPEINGNDEVVYLGGHGNYNWMTTGSGEGFMAGATGTQGDTEELNAMPDAVVVASGCHNGVNFGNRLYHDYTNNTTYGEFPERFAAREVGIYVGSTGYTWISGSNASSNAAYTGWSEKLATHFVNHLLNDGMWNTAGEAYKEAVNDYVSDYGGVGNPHRRVLAIATFYGIPNYRPPRFFVAVPWRPIGYWLEVRWIAWPLLNGVQAAASTQTVTATQSVTLKLTDWSVEPDGLITIPGASYTGDYDEPILPLVRTTQVLPSDARAVNITWDQDASESTTIENDVPLASMAVLTTSVPNSFAYDGFYPPTPTYTTTVSTLGGGGVEIAQSIIPVQYDQTTHRTRIWTRMAFEIEYELDEEALTLDSDGDGLLDFWESGYGLDPNDASGNQGGSGDPDDDGLPNADEQLLGTDPLDPDTDRDSWNDGEETAWGTDPLNPGSRPRSLFLPLVLRAHQ